MRTLITYYYIFILFLFIGVFNACISPDTETETADTPIDSTAIKLAAHHKIDSTFTATFLEHFIGGITQEEPIPIKDIKIFSTNLLPSLYDRYGYQLIWHDSLSRIRAVEIIEGSFDDGLDPEVYHLSTIKKLIQEDSSAYEEEAALDILITDAIILYGSHLLNGKTDPNSLEPTLEHENRVLSDEVLAELTKHLFSGSLDIIIEHLRPNTKYYYGMMHGLSFYQALADSGGWKKLVVTSNKIDPDSTDLAIPSIRKRLITEGDLIFESDSLTGDSLINDTHYDTLLVNAVKLFQKRHGLNPDGIIGKGTIKAMNIPAYEKVNLLKANLERARWIFHDLPKNYILVNIAGFDLRLIKDSALVWTTRVVAGKIADATPIFKDEMQYVEVNPVWRIPSSIANEEILPHLQKDSTYLARNNMKLLTGSGKSVDAALIDFTKIKKGSFPYLVEQNPGWGNSLGRIKFIFPNPHSIYLHDTPSRSHFSREQRAFSHGCIRVEDPLKLAEFVLSDLGINRHKIDSIITTRNPKRISLEKPLPVLITYSTAFSDGDLSYFYEDVYGRDAELMKALGLKD